MLLSETKPFKLNSGFRGDFERASTDKFIADMKYIGDLSLCKLG